MSDRLPVPVNIGLLCPSGYAAWPFPIIWAWLLVKEGHTPTPARWGHRLERQQRLYLAYVG